jgi:hypothetical protein
MTDEGGRKARNGDARKTTWVILAERLLDEDAAHGRGGVVGEVNG